MFNISCSIYIRMNRNTFRKKILKDINKLLKPLQLKYRKYFICFSESINIVNIWLRYIQIVINTTLFPQKPCSLNRSFQISSKLRQWITWFICYSERCMPYKVRNQSFTSLINSNVDFNRLLFECEISTVCMSLCLCYYTHDK